MFGRNIALAHLHSFTQRIFQHALGARRERDVRARFGLLLAFGHAGDDLKSLLVRYAHAFESLRSNAVRLFRQAKQQMLSATCGRLSAAASSLASTRTCRALSVNLSNAIYGPFL